VRGLPYRRVVRVQVAANRAHHHLAAIEPDPHLNGHAFGALDLTRILLHRRLHGEGGVARPHSMILMPARRPKQRHNPIPHHLVHGALIATDMGVWDCCVSTPGGACCQAKSMRPRQALQWWRAGHTSGGGLPQLPEGATILCLNPLRMDGTVAVPVPSPDPPVPARQHAAQRQVRRQTAYEQAWALYRQGWTVPAIARRG
jgi:hypothetical protein